MKRIVLIITLIILVAMGCQSSNIVANTETVELQTKLKSLEDQVSIFKTEVDELAVMNNALIQENTKLVEKIEKLMIV